MQGRGVSFIYRTWGLGDQLRAEFVVLSGVKAIRHSKE